MIAATLGDTIVHFFVVFGFVFGLVALFRVYRRNRGHRR